ncbi:MAG: pilus assembly protein [Pseudomonadales bacterium]
MTDRFKKFRFAGQQLLIAFSVIVSGATTVGAQAATLALSDVPLFLLESTPPNLVISYDDSGSMMWAYLPDSIRNDANVQTRAATKSNFHNKMYYNPLVDYRPGLNANGDSLGEANFLGALTNIYNYGAEAAYEMVRPSSVDLSTAFQPIWNPTTIAGWGQQYSGPVEPAYYYNRIVGCVGAVLDDSCYTKVVVSATSGPMRARPDQGFVVSADERTNFANWYQYYSYRTLAGKTVLSRAFSPEKISSSIRVAHQTINQRGVKSGAPGVTNYGGDQYVAQFNTAERNFFYQWLQNLQIGGGTPLLPATREVGDYFSSVGNDSPYSVNPGSSSEQVSCRVNAHIMLSDGYWNGGGQQNNIVRDENIVALPDGTSYNPASLDHNIYQDAQPQVTLADVAFNYWATDLSPLENNVAPYFPSATGSAVKDYWNPVNDPADWQHMVNFNIAFGIAGLVPLTKTAYDALIDGNSFVNADNANQTGWTTLESTEEAKADDMYHAALNSRGQFFSASDPDELVDSLVSVMNSIADRESSAAAVDLNSNSIASGVGVFQSRFFTDNWTGDLQARPLSDGENSNACNSLSFGSICEPAWSAAQLNTVETLFPSGIDQRTVFTLNPNSALGSRGARFIWPDLSAAQKTAIQDNDSSLVAQQRLDYLRGSSQNEERNNGPFRTRTATRLGAIVHSSPAFVGNGFDVSGDFERLYPDDIESSGELHRDFLCKDAVDSNADRRIDTCSSGIRNSRTPVVYVGSNDGMLHAYDGRIDHADGGKELFSFVPNAVIENLHELSEPTFTNGSYVDGELGFADVFYSNSWHTILVGGLRTGGQAYYALDVTDPAAVSSQTPDAANKLVRWEFTDDNTSGVAEGAQGANGDKDLGFTFGASHIVKVNYTGGGSNTGRWVAIFGNGYNSTYSDGNQSSSGHAVLYVVDIETGLLIKKLDTGVGTTASPNGISGIAPVLNDDDLTVDYVYAGDLHGNLWKFDISSDDIADWDSAYSASSLPAPLFTAIASGSVQPIQSTPQVSRHFLGGNLVYFGTGKYLEESDNATDDQQSFYAVWDKDVCTVGATTLPCKDVAAGTAKTHQVNAISRASMQGQQQTVDTSGVRQTSNNTVNWSTATGWYLDFPTGAGERAIGKPVLRGEIVLFNTLEPDDEVCEAGGSSWLYALDRIDGGPPPVQVFDTNGDGEIDSSDYIGGVSSAAFVDAVISDPTYAEGSGGKDVIIYGSSDLSAQGGGIGVGVTPDTTVEGRVRWRQLN